MLRALPRSGLSRRLFSTSPPPRYEGPSFAFDIDGVLQRGGAALAPGLSALQLLYHHPSARWRAPVVFLTNGGGSTEQARAAHLSARLRVPIHASQVVLSHTPMRAYAARYNALSDACVLTVGPPGCAAVASSYGFARPLDLDRLALALSPAAPFARFAGLPALSVAHHRTARLRVAAVFVMSDSPDWGRDVQLLVDVLASDGSPRRRPAPEQVVDLFYCNPDITFPNEYHLPRLAGGAFRVALEAVFERVTGRKLAAVHFGKPYPPNYELAEQSLKMQARRLGFCGDSEPHTVYAVGDNPHSDVRGANARGEPWVSVLVRTGNFQGDNDKHDPAHIVLDDAHKAVQHALERHGEEHLRTTGAAND